MSQSTKGRIMQLRYLKSVAVAIAAAGAFGMAAGSANAATANTNGLLTGVEGTAVPAATKLTVTPTGGGTVVVVRCTSSAATLDVLGPVVTGPLPLTIGTNVVPTFTGCSVAGAIPVTVSCAPKPNSTVLQATALTSGGITAGQITGIDCTITVSTQCTGTVTGSADGSYNNTGTLTMGSTQNLYLTANCPSNVLRSGISRYGSDTPGSNPPGPLTYQVTSTPIPNVVVS